MSDPLFNSKSDKAKLSDDHYCIELLRRATLQGDLDAWKIVQELLSETVRGWISQHPRRVEACRLDSEENYVDQAFARFYLLTISQQVEFSQLSSALQYLKVCLNGVILKRLRAFSRPPAIPLLTLNDTSESTVAHSTDNVIVWNILTKSFPSPREQRLAYLLYQCGLSPKDIVNSYPQEYTDVREISLLRQAIFECMLQYFDHSDDQKTVSSIFRTGGEK